MCLICEDECTCYAKPKKRSLKDRAKAAAAQERRAVVKSVDDEASPVGPHDPASSATPVPQRTRREIRLDPDKLIENLAIKLLADSGMLHPSELKKHKYVVGVEPTLNERTIAWLRRRELSGELEG
jgi:hypothetical protein